MFYLSRSKAKLFSDHILKRTLTVSPCSVTFTTRKLKFTANDSRSCVPSMRKKKKYIFYFIRKFKFKYFVNK